MQACRHCAELDFRSSHAETSCPFRASAYCFYCASFGHFSAECPDPPPREAVEPVYMEQLIPVRTLREYGITSRTPIALAGRPKPEPVYLEVQDDDYAIRSYLINKGIAVARDIKKNKIRLQAYANAIGQKLVYR